MKSSIIGIVSLLALAVSSCTNYQEEEAPVSFSVNQEELSFSQNGESQSLIVSSGTEWDVTDLPSWINLRSINRSGLSRYEWTADFYSASNEEYNRDGKIVFKSQNGSVEVSVSQEGKKGRFVAVESVTLSKTELTMTVGESVALTYGIVPSDASIKDVSWESGSTAVATVTQSGQIDAISEGDAIITLKTKDGGKTASCSVTVKPVAVSSVTLDKETLSLKIGESYSLIATVLPESAANKKVSWSSSNKSVATVDETGKVTAEGVGSAKIIVTTNDGGKTATCSVVVSSISVTGVSLNKASLSLTIGGTEQLIATVAPTNATNKNVTWSSSNSNVATVDSNGNVSAIKVGTAIITATTEDGGKKATCSVTVNPVSVTGVSLNQTSLTMAVGDTQTLAATVTPSNATDKSVTWSSSNTSVATVSSSGVVTAKAAGTATITVTTTDGGKKATCAVTVQAQKVSVTGVSLNKTSLSMTVGDNQTLTATVTPSNASDQSVIWSSSNTSVATVSSSGVVTAMAAGSATITVTTNDGGKKATCAVTVQAQKVSVTGVSLNKSSLSMTVGDTQTLTATVTPSNATDKSVTWSSSNTSVATVSSNGVIIARGIGDCIIEAKAGSFYSRCYVSVYSKDDVSTPLSFSIVSGGEIWWVKEGTAEGMGIIESSNNCIIEYQINGQNWIQLYPGGRFSVEKNDIVSFRGDNEGYGYYVTSGDNYSCSYHSFSGTAVFNVFGNIMSLIDKTNYSTKSTLPTNATFAGLFKYTHIVSSKRLVLPAGIATDACYWGMFSSCDNLIDMPCLPASVVSSRSYYRMFEQCTSLSSITNLPALSLGYECYALMFVGCEKISTAPALPAEILATRCYQQMFQGCSSLSYIEAFFTTTPSSAYTLSWTTKVATYGTFVKNKKAGWSLYGKDGIPDGWTVEYK